MEFNPETEKHRRTDPEETCLFQERILRKERSRIEQALMIIIDTSVWIEFFRAHQPFFNQVSDILARNEALALSPIFGELLQGAKNSAERELIAEVWTSLPKMNETGLFVRAGAESGRNRWTDKGVGLIDGVIITAARETISFIWTLDDKLNRLLKREEIYIPS